MPDPIAPGNETVTGTEIIERIAAMSAEAREMAANAGNSLDGNYYRGLGMGLSHAMTALRAMSTQAFAQGAEWLPIDSAPKDGTLMFLDYGDGRRSLGRWLVLPNTKPGGVWRKEANILNGALNTFSHLHGKQPLRFAPLPPPPAGQSGGE